MIRQHWRSFLLGLLSGLMAAGFVLLFISRPRRYPIQLLPPPTASPLRIHVAGAVRHPGVYAVPINGIWESAIIAAGGELPEADLERINLAAPLEDGQHLFVPYRMSTDPGSPTGAPPDLNVASLVDVNHATLFDLEQLPGIGPSLAKNIVDFRETHGFFLIPEDLLQVSGIGPSKLAQIRDLIICR
jgi:competence protein ComEA